MPASKIQADRVKNALTHPIAAHKKHFFLFDVWRAPRDERYKLQSDDHSVLEPPLPIPNRTVKRDRANDSALACVKVGHRQTHTHSKPRRKSLRGFVRLLTTHSNQRTKKRNTIRVRGAPGCNSAGSEGGLQVRTGFKLTRCTGCDASRIAG